MEELLRTWGALVAERRSERGISQRKLSILIGVSQGAINHLEKGRYSPSDEVRMRIAGKLHVRVEQLFPYPDVNAKGEAK